jgi:hypothetical protein
MDVSIIWAGSLKTTITPCCVSFERAAVLDNLLANCSVVYAQQRYYVLRVGTFGDPVTPRRSQKSAVISRRWLSSCFSAPDATIMSATCGGRKRRNLLIRSISSTWSETRLFELLVELGIGSGIFGRRPLVGSPSALERLFIASPVGSGAS